jgi:hypothetical protein
LDAVTFVVASSKMQHADPPWDQEPVSNWESPLPLCKLVGSIGRAFLSSPQSLLAEAGVAQTACPQLMPLVLWCLTLTANGNVLLIALSSQCWCSHEPSHD